ncbi:helix-turn-helix transcriptional regulator [Chitinophaga horti]|uniref:Helix-turn-helix transcriptional regulator n=1 Tax=Chitinophaga horti TaxID=2920382 RepID=A0ABY6J7A6_9BACT|nr:helix-turn-helix transcriptional regulator [Chitinophaga horti]UYQ95472.1 helix-turn-helix transcriptional regulator [Chitinophaga horti]
MYNHTTLNTANHQPDVIVRTPFFSIFTLGELQEQLLTDAGQTHRHDFVEVLWLTNGGGQLIVNLHAYELTPARLYGVAPGQLHQLSLSDDAAGKILRFNEAFLYTGDVEPGIGYRSDFYQLLQKASDYKLEEETAAELEDLISKLSAEHNSDKPYRAEMMRRYLKIFFVHIAREQAGNHTTETYAINNRLADKFISLLDKHYATTKTVAEYAAMLFVTPNYLSWTVKKSTGFSARHHIRERIIQEAQCKAASQDCSMKEIAWALGFSDIGHFSKYFKNASGTNFSDFKKSHMAMA